MFKFVNAQEAAEFNTKILKACDYDYEKLLLKQKKTTISYGSEFRIVSNLKELLRFHSNWNIIEIFSTKGTDTSLLDINENVLKNDCLSKIDRGNHKSASKSRKVIEFLNKTYYKEVKLGWMIPMSISVIPKLKYTCVIPVGLVSQMTMDE